MPPGIEARFRALVKQIKAHPAYNPSVGEVFCIEGAVNTDFRVGDQRVGQWSDEVSITVGG